MTDVQALHPDRRPILSQQWVDFYNSGRETVEAHAPLEIHAFSIQDKRPILHGRVPTEEGGERYPKMINALVPVEYRQKGACTNSGLVIARMIQPSGDAEWNDWFVPDSDDWTRLKRTKIPPWGEAFHFVGQYTEIEGEDASSVGLGVFQYRQVQHGIIYGKLQEEMAAADAETDAPQTATCLHLPADLDAGTLDDTGSETFEGRSRWNVTIDADTIVGFDREPGGWIAVVRGCP